VLVVLLAILGTFRTVHHVDFQIDTSAGVNESFYMEVGGLEQFVQIRGQDVSNPVIIAVHGGPANPLPMLAFRTQDQLEEYFTIVHWDQRGSGRTYFKNRNIEQPDPSLETILQDMDEVVDYARERFGQEQVIVKGQSWGTIVSTHYVQRHPEKVSAFVAVSPVVNMAEGAGLVAGKALANAEEANSSDAEELRSLLENLQATTEYNSQLFRDYYRLQVLTFRHLPNENNRGIPQIAWACATSPTINLTDLRWFMTMANVNRFESLQNQILHDAFAFDARNHAPHFEVPVYILVGDQDWITPVELTQLYFAHIEAPTKELTVLPNVGHSPFLEVPDQYQAAILNFLQGSDD